MRETQAAVPPAWRRKTTDASHGLRETLAFRRSHPGTGVACPRRRRRRTLFLDEDAVERSWGIVAPILDASGAVHPYAAGTWGPSAADDLIALRAWQLGGGDSGTDTRSVAAALHPHETTEAQRWTRWDRKTVNEA